MSKIITWQHGRVAKGHSLAIISTQCCLAMTSPSLDVSKHKISFGNTKPGTSTEQIQKTKFLRFSESSKQCRVNFSFAIYHGRRGMWSMK